MSAGRPPANANRRPPATPGATAPNTGPTTRNQNAQRVPAPAQGQSGAASPGQVTKPKPTPSPPPIPPPPNTADAENVNKLIIITERATYDQLLADVGRKHLLVEFFAPWCGACMLINKTIEELATAYNGRLVIAKVNVEECEEIAIDNGVTMMPAFMLMRENQVLEKFAGSSEEKLTSTIKKFVGEPVGESGSMSEASAQPTPTTQTTDAPQTTQPPTTSP